VVAPTDPAHPRARRPSAFALGVSALFALYLVLAVLAVVQGRINHDEGWYLYAAGRVLEGELPYRDFAYFQAPLLPFVYAPAQQLFGPGVAVGRLTSFALSIGTVALGARLAFVHGGRLAALFFLAILCLTPQQLWAFTTTRTEPLVAFWLMLGAFLLLARPVSARASAVALAATVLAAGTRISALPAALLVMVWVTARHRRSGRDLALALGPGLVVGLALVGLVMAASFDAAVFNVITAQTERHAQLRETEAVGVWRHVEARLRALHELHTGFGIVPLLALISACAAPAAWLALRRDPARAALPGAASALAALALAAYLPNLTPRAVHSVYFTSVYPLGLVLVAWGIGELHRRASPVGRRAFGAALVGLIAAQAVGCGAQIRRHTSHHPADLAELREVSAYLARVVPPGGTLVTMESTLAVEGGLRIAPGWEMDIFSYFPRRSEAEATRHHVLSQDAVRRSLRDPTVDAVVLSDHSLGVLAGRGQRGYRHFEALSEERLRAVLPDLGRYRLARVFPEFGQFRDRLYVLLPVGR
jgi:4-amino-4-deoxy-L-arabinose transferase-like glycosyltransferase